MGSIPNKTKRIIGNTVKLARIPSQADVDKLGPVVFRSWQMLKEAGLEPEILHDENGFVRGVAARVDGSQQGPNYAVTAAIDTTPVKDASEWTNAPFMPKLENGRMYGVGVADGKVMAALFTEVASAMNVAKSKMQGSLTIFLEADNHAAGRKQGMECLLDRYPDISGVFVGAPGMQQVSSGYQGAVLADVKLFGETEEVAEEKVRHLKELIDEKIKRRCRLDLGKHGAQDAVDFDGTDLKPIANKKGEFVAGLTLNVLTNPNFTDSSVHKILLEAVGEVEKAWAGKEDLTSAQINVIDSHADRSFEDEAKLAQTLAHFARHSERAYCLNKPRPIREEGTTPLTVGSPLYAKGIPVVSHGVAHRNAHGVDERVWLESIPRVLDTYFGTLRSLLSVDETIPSLQKREERGKKQLFLRGLMSPPVS